MKPVAWLGIGIGIGVGVGLAVLSPALFAQASRGLRPQAKELSKGAVRTYLQAREGVAHFGEYLEDVMAEAKAEVVAERRAAAEAMAAGVQGSTEAPGAGNGRAEGMDETDSAEDPTGRAS